MENLYKKNPLVVEAYQFTVPDAVPPGTWATELTGYMFTVGDHNPLPIYLDEYGPLLYLQTKHGQAAVRPGMWIIREPDDSGWYPCTDAIFRDTYTRLSEAEND